MHSKGVQVFQQILKCVPIQKRLTTTGMHNNHLHNTDNGGKPMGEELRYVQMNRSGMQIGEQSK